MFGGTTQKKKKSRNINPLLNILAPPGISIKSNSIDYGDKKTKIIGISKFPQTEDVGYLSRITNLQNTVVNIHYDPVDNGGLLEAINKIISQREEEKRNSTDNITKTRCQIAIDNANKLLQKIEQDNESVGQMDTLIMALADDSAGLENMTRKVGACASSIKSNVRSLSNLQKQCFQNLAPFYTKNQKIADVFGKIVPLSSFVGGFPFGTTGFNDGQGYYIAKDVNNSLIIADLWRRVGDRTNTNLVCTGKPGQGKSTIVKLFLLNEYARGTKIICIDPEREYKGMAETLNGDWINCSGGKNKINPFEILKAPQDEDESELSPLAKHMESLEAFLRLYNREIDESTFAYLKKNILACYAKFGITFDTNIENLKSSDYPTFSDLYNYIKENGDDTSLSRSALDAIEDVSNGADKFLWNGYTNLKINKTDSRGKEVEEELSSNFIVFDTKDLQNATDSKKSTQYYNILRYAWNIIEQNRKERVILVCDEAYLMIDKFVPQTLVFLRNASKRIRKYEGGLFIISHDVCDFLDPAVKQYGQAILSNATYKVLCGTDGQNLKDEVDIFNLTEHEKELLEEQKRGHALFIAGNSKIHANFVIDEKLLSLMGSAGGR